MKKLLIIFLLLVTINVKATNTIVMDMDSKRILYEDKAYEQHLIASITKIMTFVVAYEYGKPLLNEKVSAGKEILSMYGTSIYLNYQEEMTLKDLLYGLLLRSGNDASVVIANYIGGSEEKFVKLMNDKAASIGMHNTVFHNSHGLDEETRNYSTAYDMALLSSYANKIPFYKTVSQTKYYNTKTANKAYSWTNRNKLLFTYENCTGGKTGYTPSAGKTLVSTATKNNLNLTIVSLADDNHYEHHKSLYENYFAEYQNYLLLDKNIFNQNNLYAKQNLYLLDNIYYPIKESEINKLHYRLNLEQKKVEVILGDKVVLTKNLYVKEKEIDKKISFFQKIKKFLQEIF